MYQKLFSVLNRNLDLLENSKINSKIGKSRDFEIIQLNKTFLVIKEPSEKEVSATIQIGFPFPLSKRKISLKFKNKITFCFYGDELRRFQRELMEMKFKTTKNKIGKLSFRKKVKSTINNGSEINYICPYTFRGDTYISEYFFEEFEKKFRKKVNHKFSQLSKDIEGYNKYNISELSKIKNGSVIIMPDLIDTHLEKSLETILKLNKKFTAFLIGRNLIIEKDKELKIYWNGEPDVLLKRENIDYYMQNCLRPFVGKTALVQKGDGEFSFEKVFINTHSSQKVRDLSVKNAKTIVQFFLNISKKVYINYGEKNSKKDSNWIKEFKRKHSELYERVIIVKEDNLKDLSLYLIKNKITFGVSVDTSIPHLLAKQKIPCIVMIKKEQFDNTSEQSIIQNSSVGFSRISQPQIPILIKSQSKLIQKQLSKIVNILNVNKDIFRKIKGKNIINKMLEIFDSNDILYEKEFFMKHVKSKSVKKSYYNGHPLIKIWRLKKC